MVPHYHVTIVRLDGASISHAGLIRDHAEKLFEAACLEHGVLFVNLGTWTLRGSADVLEWQVITCWLNENAAGDKLVWRE